MKKDWIFEEAAVESYAGYRGAETPRAFSRRGRRVEIRKVLDRWYEGGLDPLRPVHEYFKVETEGEEVVLLRHTPAFQVWAICRGAFAPPEREN